MKQLTTYFALLVLVFSMLQLPAASAQTAETRPLELTDIMQFREIDQRQQSENLETIAFSANPDYGDREGVVVRSQDGETFSVPRGHAPKVSSDGAFVVFMQEPPLLDREQASSRDERAKLVSNAVLVNVSTGEQQNFSHAGSAAFSGDGNYLLVLHEKEFSKENGSPEGQILTLISLSSGEQTQINNISDYAVAEKGSRVVWVEHTKHEEAVQDEAADSETANSDNESAKQDPKVEAAVVMFNTANNQRNVLDRSTELKYSKLTFAPNAEFFAFLSGERETKLTETPQTLWLWQQGQASARAADVARNGMILSEHSAMRFSDDSQRLFIGHRPNPEEKQETDLKPKSAEDLYNLDRLLGDRRLQVWHGDDGMIQPQQRQNYNRMLRATAAAVFYPAAGTMVALSNEPLESISLNDHPFAALAWNSEPYQREVTWNGFHHDLYWVNLTTGERKLVAEKLRSSERGSLSPNGRYVVFVQDNELKRFDSENGRSEVVGENANVSWVNEENDVPAEPRSYGVAGWAADSSAFWVYDRFDIWQIAANGNATNLTQVGRDNDRQFRVAYTDDHNVINAAEPVLLRAYHERLKTSGFYQLDVAAGELTTLIEGEKTYSFLAHSEDKQQVLFTEQDFRQFPDLMIAGRDFAAAKQLTNVNPQQSEFVWGNAELVEWESTRGEPLQGVLIKPDNYDANKRYPVMVYFYEKFSQRLYQWNQMKVNHRPNFPYFLGQDYVVFLPDVHFRHGAPGPSATESLVPAMEKIIEMGVADPDAIGLHGHSWSGYQAAFLVAETDIFAAVVSGAPVSNMTSAYSGIRWGSGLARQFQYETGQSRIGDSMYDNLEPYLKNSPVFVADKINTPMLIQFGDKDEAVPWEQGIEYYLALRRLDKPVVMLQYEGEPHHLQRYANKIDYTLKMLEFFDYYLKGEEAPEWWVEGLEYQHYE
ncbi:dipeptidyl aminopeptidase/acylaminoacyl peptidase [Idiomarina sp. A28L]|uniref:S9 family peptidase n=1 Tax=Idiomarina sp. A28L TaxID=1036674 RepID=UPI00021387CF|nr:prolyl oligopeptidase family serine peptidase [Idiomarina sp. A28L]EGN76446.1 dipeptidyl aminopeptidase/acylaminoacyl peptidase [Idiomarina sp. A28L]